MATYNRVIRKLVVAFGDLFKDITLVRYNPDETESERFVIPITYATKELYVQRLQGDPDLDKRVQMTLPRLSYEMSGFTYDATRKQNTNIRNVGVSNSNGAIAQYNPVPYNFDFKLYLYVRNIEDASQVLEHVLSYFTPDYTIKLNMIPEMGIVREVPILLNGTEQDIVYEGNRDSDTRMIIWTLNFTAKAYIYGSISSVGLIKTSITNILNDISPSDSVILNMTLTNGVGNYKLGETVYQGYNLSTATASGEVESWTNGRLTLTNVSGNFISSRPIIGSSTNANYTFESYQFTPVDLAKVIVVPNPTTANVNDSYTYTTIISESANGANVVIPSTTSYIIDLNTENKYIDLL